MAEVRLDFPIVSTPDSRTIEQPLASAPATPFRRVFPSYSRRDLQVVEQIELYSKTLGDDYLRDLVSIRPGEEWNPRLQELIAKADVFQLFWSSNSANSRFVEEEWRFAAGLRRPYFIRPTYWEDPIPDPPGELAAIHFQKLWIRPYGDANQGSTGKAIVQLDSGSVPLKKESVRITLQAGEGPEPEKPLTATGSSPVGAKTIPLAKAPSSMDPGPQGGATPPQPGGGAKPLPQATVKMGQTQPMGSTGSPTKNIPKQPNIKSTAEEVEEEWEEEYERDREFLFVPKQPEVCLFALFISAATAFLAWIFTNRTDSISAGVVSSTDTFVRCILAGGSLLVAWITSIGVFWLLNRFFGRKITAILGLFTVLILLVPVIYFCLK